MSHDRSSLKSMKVFVQRQFQSELSSHTTSSSVQDQRAWIVDSGASLHWSQTELSIMVRCSKFSLVGNEFWRALHFRFLILFVTYKDQIPHPSDLSLSNCSSWISASSSAFKNQYSNLLVYDPLWVKGQNKLSSASCYDNGIVLAKSVSSRIKMLSINSWFHCLVCFVYENINLSTCHKINNRG